MIRSILILAALAVLAAVLSYGGTASGNDQDLNLDADGDGFYDELEEALGSDPDDDASKPEHMAVHPSFQFPDIPIPDTCDNGSDDDSDGLTDAEDPGCDMPPLIPFETGGSVPPAGQDAFPTGAIVQGMELAGPTVIQRGDPQDTIGLPLPDHIPVEIIAMELRSADGSVVLREDPAQRSTGQVNSPETGGNFFPAEAFFDVFFRVFVNEEEVQRGQERVTNPEVHCLPPVVFPQPCHNNVLQQLCYIGPTGTNHCPEWPPPPPPPADVELLEINKGQPIPAVECETPHQPANGRAMALDPGTGLIYYTESDGFGHNLTQIIEAVFTPSTVCPTISECQVEGAIPGKPFGGLPIPIGTLAHDPGRSAAAGVPVFWGADYTGGGVTDIFEIKYTPPVCPAFHLTQVPMPAHPCLAHFFQSPGFTDGMDYDPNTDTLWFSDDASQLVFEQPIGGADPQLGEQVPPGFLKFEIVKCNTGIAFNPLAGEPNPLWLVEYAINMPVGPIGNIEEVYLSQRSGQNPPPAAPAGTQVFEALAYDSGLHPPDIRNSRAWEDAEFDETADAEGDCGVFSNQNGIEILPSGNNVGQTVHTIIRWSVPCAGVAQETVDVSEQTDIGLTAMFRNNGPRDPVDIIMWKRADAPVDCEVSIHTEDFEEITIADGVLFFEKVDGTPDPSTAGFGPASLVPGPGHTIVARGTPGVDFELDVHLVIPNNPSTASPFGAKLAHHELFDKHCFQRGLHDFEFCVELQPVEVPDPDPTNNSLCVSETVEAKAFLADRVCDSEREIVCKKVQYIDEDRDGIIEVGEPVRFIKVFEVQNPSPNVWENTTLEDRWGAEIDVDEPVGEPINPTQGTATLTTKGKSEKEFLRWDIGTLNPGETATLVLEARTDLNPAGKQEYSECSIHEFNSGAVLKFMIPDRPGQRSFETGGVLVSVLTEDAQGDCDGDGFSDAEELAAGTDPHDPADFPIIKDCDVGCTD